MDDNNQTNSFWQQMMGGNNNQDSNFLMQGVGGNTGGYEPSFWDSMTGYKDPTTGKEDAGWGKSALGTAGAIGKLGVGLFGAYQSKKALDLAEDQFGEQKRQYAQNYAAQQKTTNALMEQKAKNRYLADPRNNLTADQYMKEHGV